MALDPDIQSLIDNLPQGIALPVGDHLVARRTFHDLSVAVGQAQPPSDLKATEQLTVPGATGELPARLYRPHAEGDTTTLLFIHGGGFVVGDIDSYDLTARTLAEKSGHTVLSVDYRLAPEDPFPAGIDDVLSIARWTLDNIHSLGGDVDRVIVSGDSAGGNFAAVVAQQMKDVSPGFSGQLLLYPVVDFAVRYPSHEAHADGPVLTEAAGLMFNAAYVPAGAELTDPMLSPLHAADLSGLPPTIVATAEYDMLQDEGKLYAQKLTDAGVQVTHFHYDTLPHGFFGFGPFSAGARSAIDEVSTAVGGLVPA